MRILIGSVTLLLATLCSAPTLAIEVPLSASEIAAAVTYAKSTTLKEMLLDSEWIVTPTTGPTSATLQVRTPFFNAAGGAVIGAKRLDENLAADAREAVAETGADRIVFAVTLINESIDENTDPIFAVRQDGKTVKARSVKVGQPYAIGSSEFGREGDGTFSATQINLKKPFTVVVANINFNDAEQIQYEVDPSKMR